MRWKLTTAATLPPATQAGLVGVGSPCMQRAVRRAPHSPRPTRPLASRWAGCPRAKPCCSAASTLHRSPPATLGASGTKLGLQGERRGQRRARAGSGRRLTGGGAPGGRASTCAAPIAHNLWPPVARLMPREQALEAGGTGAGSVAGSPAPPARSPSAYNVRLRRPVTTPVDIPLLASGRLAALGARCFPRHWPPPTRTLTPRARQAAGPPGERQVTLWRRSRGLGQVGAAAASTGRGGGATRPAPTAACAAAAACSARVHPRARLAPCPRHEACCVCSPCCRCPLHVGRAAATPCQLPAALPPPRQPRCPPARALPAARCAPRRQARRGAGPVAKGPTSGIVRATGTARPAPSTWPALPPSRLTQPSVRLGAGQQARPKLQAPRQRAVVPAPWSGCRTETRTAAASCLAQGSPCRSSRGGGGVQRVASSRLPFILRSAASAPPPAAAQAVPCSVAAAACWHGHLAALERCSKRAALRPPISLLTRCKPSEAKHCPVPPLSELNELGEETTGRQGPSLGRTGAPASAAAGRRGRQRQHGWRWRWLCDAVLQLPLRWQRRLSLSRLLLLLLRLLAGCMRRLLRLL